MDFDAEIDAALDALSDGSSEDVDVSGDEEIVITSSESTTDNVDWMKLFLERTSEQSKKIEDGLCAAEMVLEEVSKTVNECHSARLAILDGESSSSFSSDICNEKKNALQVVEPLNDSSNQDNNLENAIITIEQESSPAHNDQLFEDVDELQIHKQEIDQRMLSVETSYNEEIAHRIDDIEAKRIATERHLIEMENAERQILMELDRQKAFYVEERLNNAACMIQCCYRRYAVRKQYGHVLDERLRQRKEERTRARILAFEEKRREQKKIIQEIENLKETNKNVHDEQSLKESGAFLTSPTKTGIQVSAESDSDGRDVEITKTVDPSDHHFDISKPQKEEFSVNKTNVLAGNNLSDNDVLVAHLASPNTEKKEIDGIFIETNRHSPDDVKDSVSVSGNVNATVCIACDSTSPSPKPAHDKAGFETSSSVGNENAKGQRPKDVKQNLPDDISLKQASLPNASMVGNENSDNVPLKLIEFCSTETSDVPENPTAAPISKQNENERFHAIKRDLAILEKSVSFEKEYRNNEPTSCSESSPLTHEANKAVQNDDERKRLRDDIDKDLSLLEASVDFSTQTSTIKSNFVETEEHPSYSPLECIEEQTIKVCAQSDALSSNVIDPNISQTALDESRTKDSALHEISSPAELRTCSPDQEAILSDSCIEKTLTSSLSNFPNQIEQADSSDEDKGSEILPTPRIATSFDHKQQNSVEESNETNQDSSDASVPLPSPVSDDKNAFCDNTTMKQTTEVVMQSPNLVCTTSNVPPTVETKEENLRFSHAVAMSTNGDDASFHVDHANDSTDNELKEPDLRSNSANDRLDEGRRQESIHVKELVSSPTNSCVFDPRNDVFPSSLQTKDEATMDETGKVDDGGEKSKRSNSSTKSDFDVIYSLTKAWKNWKNQCKKWNNIAEANELAKPRFRRIIRKSSAAKKLPPISQDEILTGKWPHYKELPEVRTLESLSRICIRQSEGSGRNLTVIHRCVNLTHLTLIKCGLVSLEGLQACPSLRHINVSHNNITFVSCDGMKRLESLVATGNRLTSIHGLNGCNAMLLVDMSYNNIARINGLEETPNLTHLRLSHNQLLSVDGLRFVRTLISLDVSHNNISSLEGIEPCGLLRYLNASDNYFSHIPFGNLRNAVLLIQLDLSGNSISNMHSTAEDVIFLPSLLHVDLRKNKISLEDMDFPSWTTTPLLQTLNLSRNLISNIDILIHELKQLKYFKELCLSENLFSKEKEIESFEKIRNYGFSASFSDDATLPSPTKTIDAIKSCLALPARTEKNNSVLIPRDESYLKEITEQTHEYMELLSAELAEVKSMRGWRKDRDETDGSNASKVLRLPLEAFACHCDYLKRQFETAIHHRRAHEGLPVPRSQAIKLKEDGKEIDGVFEPSAGHTPGTGVESHLQTAATKVKSDFVSGDNPVPVQDPTVPNEMESSKSSSSIEANKGIPTSHSTQRVVADSLARCGDSRSLTTVRSSTNTKLVYEELQRSKTTPALENLAAQKIQNIWKEYRAKKTNRNKPSRSSKAATLIQSAWRGYILRRDIKKAFASFNASSDLEGEDFEEVDLSQLEFDEDSYNQQWAFKTNVFRNLTPVAPSRPLSTEPLHLDRRCTPSPSLLTRRSRNTSPEEVVNSQSMWQKIASLNKPPLPPITPTGSATGDHKLIVSDGYHDSSSLLDSHRSKHSRKEEMLTNEWGLQSSSATELMLKRARRMKGRRKKEVTAQEKLRRFQDLSDRVTQQPLMTQQKTLQPKNRMDYFKAREMEFEQHDKKPSEDDERRRQYTYEWLHTSAHSQPTNPHAARSRGRHASPHRTASHSSGHGRVGFLPDITQRHVTGSTQHHDMEVLSLSSYNSTQSRSKHLLKDIARRHGGN